MTPKALLLRPPATRALGGQDGPSCFMTAFTVESRRPLLLQVSRWWYVLRYYRKRQLAARLLRIGRRALRRWTRKVDQPISQGRTLALRENPGLRLLAEARLRNRSHRAARDRARAMAEGRFRFLNEERALGERVDWKLAHSPDVSRLWRFHLHYHEFLWDLVAPTPQTGERWEADRAWDLVAQWIDACRPGESWTLEDAWHPYCIARRLPVWIGLWSVAPPKAELGQRVLDSMFAQADYLARNLEWDLGGNHLLENLRALVVAGCFLACPEADRWRRKAQTILLRELREQILAHGEHFERSPMYHAAMLEALMDIREAAAREMPELSEACGEAVKRMATFLRAIVHPDGEIPLLGDSALGETPPAQFLIERALEDPAGDSVCPPPRLHSCSQEREESLPPEYRTANLGPGRRVGDYWVFRDGNDFLLFDAGPVGPDHLPAHAHADLLTIEASLGGRRLLVDSGVFDYADTPMRRYCRSTAAHNVLEIDGADQCDMWSRFRMGYRGWPTGLAWGETEGFSWVRAEHNAYRRRGVARVGRWLACRPGGPWLCVDWAEGTGAHQLTARLHLHPDAQVQPTSDREVAIDHHGRRLWLRFLAPGEVSVESGWYCPEFGSRLSAPVIRWAARSVLPAVCGWSLIWGNGSGETTLMGGGDGRPIVVWRSGARAVELRPLQDTERKGASWQ